MSKQVEYKDLRGGEYYNISFEDCCVRGRFGAIFIQMWSADEGHEEFELTTGMIQNKGNQKIIFNTVD